MPGYAKTIVKTVKPSLKATIKADKRIANLFKRKENGVYAIDTNELLDELTDLHKARQFKAFKPNEFLQSAKSNIVNWELELVSTRSRTVTIRMECFRIKRLLEEQLKDSKRYILATYSEDLKSEISNTITERKNFVDLILEPFSKLDFQLETVIQLADMLIGDLSESKWNCRGIIDAMSIEQGRD